MKLVYERDMAHNYMIPQTQQTLEEDDYRIHMLMENQIRGLLPCTVRKKNGQVEFRYDITSRQSLEQVYSAGNMNETEIRILLQGMFRTLMELKTYLLDASMLVLEPEIIYMDVETREPVFCYLPGYAKEVTESFRELTVYILQRLAASEQQAVLLGYRIYRETMEENYCLERVLKQAGKLREAKDAWDYTDGWRNDADMGQNHIGTQQGYADMQGYAGRQQNDASTWQNCTDMQQDRPDMKKKNHGQMYSPKKEAGLSQEEVKGSRRFSKKEKRQTGPHMADSGNIDQSEEDPRSSGKKQVQKTKKKDNQMNSRKKQQKKKTAFSGKSFLIICFVLTVLMTVAAAWLWKLSATQTGGILFLLIGLMAYGCSLEPKKVSAKQEEIDYEAYGLKEQSYIIEETESYKEPELQKQREVYSKSEIHPHSRDRERLGNTAVLYEQDFSEEPLMLTRIHSRVQEQIALQQETYIVGKLHTEADIVIRDSSVSRVHARIERIAGQYTLRDLNSTNGTFLNGRRLEIQECVPIQPGDTIAFARAEYQVNRY